MRKQIVLAVALVILCFNYAIAGDQFIRGISPRDAAMAGVSASFDGDGLSVFVNPASPLLNGKASISALYHSMYSSSVIGALAYSQPILGAGTISLSGAMLDMGELEERDTNNLLTGTFSDRLSSIRFTYSGYITEMIAAGLTINYLNHVFYTENSSAFGADAGIIALLPYDISVSAAINNLFKPVFTYKSGNEDILPLSYTASAGYRLKLSILPDSEIKAAVGISGYEYGNKTSLSAGTEFSVYSGLAGIRAGITNAGLCIGAFASYNGAEFSYAWTARDIEPLHRFSLSYSFGHDIRKIERSTKDERSRIEHELVEKIKTETLTAYKFQIEDLEEKGEFTSAISLCEKALIWSPDDVWFSDMKNSLTLKLNSQKVSKFINDAKGLIQENMLIEALVKLKNALDMDPENSEAKDLFASTEGALQKLSDSNIQAEAENRKLIKQYFSTGLSKYAAKDYQAALAEWDKVIKLSPLQRQVYGYIKSAQENIKKQEENVLKEAYKKEQEKNDIYNKAVLYYTQGKFEESLSQWKRLLEIDPENREARDYLKKITEEFQKLQRQDLGW